MQRRSLGGLLGVALAEWAWPSVAAAEPQATTLFTIERSKNANVVRYQARLRDGRLEPARPIEAFWLMLAEDGRREELSWAERKLAYGYRVAGASSERCVLNLVAFKQRQLLVERRGQTFRALVDIAGKRACLERIFVQTSEGTLIPSVQYLDVLGTGLDGSVLRERIHAR